MYVYIVSFFSSLMNPTYVGIHVCIYADTEKAHIAFASHLSRHPHIILGKVGYTFSYFCLEHIWWVPVKTDNLCLDHKYEKMS